MIELLDLFEAFNARCPDKPSKSENPIMRVFNSFQIVAGLMLSPFGVAWLSDQTFKGAGVAFWVAIILTLAMFIMTWMAVFAGISKWKDVF